MLSSTISYAGRLPEGPPPSEVPEQVEDPALFSPRYEGYSRIERRHEEVISQIDYTPIVLKCSPQQAILAENLALPEHGFLEVAENGTLTGVDRRNPILRHKIMIVITMYNEGYEELDTTLQGVYANLAYFKKLGISPEDIGVCLVVDGMKAFLEEKDSTGRVHQKDLQPFHCIFDERKLLDFFRGERDTTKYSLPGVDRPFAHLFRSHTTFGVDSRDPAYIYLCIKQTNRGKLDSHYWFFSGLCGEANPEHVLILDVGTQPEGKSLYYMWDAMDRDEELAGCCGEIIPRSDECFNLVVDAQRVEYKFAHIFDKALESLVGYITVLPGAFSAYRWAALHGTPLWRDYFKPLQAGEESLSSAEKNMYLAEDRILCLALVTLPESAYRLKYLNYASATTDVPENFSTFLLQRRRWINGSWFALMQLVKKSCHLYKQRHHPVRKFFFFLLMLYFVLNIVFSWLLVAFFFLILAVSLRAFEAQNETSSDAIKINEWATPLYVLGLVLITMSALSVPPRRIEGFYSFLTVIYGPFMIAGTIIVALVISEDNFEGQWVSYLIFAGILVIGLNVLLNGASILIAKNIMQFLFMTPAYVNILYIFAICNTHDLTWGNRDSNITDTNREIKKNDESFRWKWLLIWVFCNLSVGYVMYKWEYHDPKNQYIYGISVTGGFLLILRATIGIVYKFQQLCERRSMLRKVQIRKAEYRGALRQSRYVAN